MSMVTPIVVGGLGIQGCFIAWGYLQERITTSTHGAEQERFKYYVVLNLIQTVMASLVALLGILLTRRSGPRIPSVPQAKLFAMVAVTNTCSTPCALTALKYVTYPTMLLAKSCKLLPVMVANVIWGVRYKMMQYLTVLCITAGVILFQFSGKQSSKDKIEVPGYGSLGLGLLFLSLVFDGFTNSTQEQLTKQHGFGGLDLMLWTNLGCSMWMVAYLLLPFLGLTPLLTDEISLAIQFASRHNIYQDLVMYGLANAGGQVFIFYVLSSTGSALVLLTLTLTRKIFSVLVSVFLFSHSINSQQTAAIALVFGAITLEVVLKMAGAKKKTS